MEPSQAGSINRRMRVMTGGERAPSLRPSCLTRPGPVSGVTAIATRYPWGRAAAPIACPSAGRKLDVDQRVGASEIADRLGVHQRQAVHMWQRRHADFRQPVAKLRLGQIWCWPEVERWAKKTGRLPERTVA